ncbi:hypothetical protein [Ottowia thiooxydans]|uniref:hypothetical protein n=1 Tax=Ottowia thiooxydans TaxID=219182 RepID=UPI003393D016
MVTPSLNGLGFMLARLLAKGPHAQHARAQEDMPHGRVPLVPKVIQKPFKGPW